MKRFFLIMVVVGVCPAGTSRAAPADVDLAFDTGSGGGIGPGIIRIIVPQPDGKVIVGGGVTDIGGAERRGITRLNANGTADSLFDPGTGANGSVLSVALQTDGKLVVGGSFTTINGTSRYGIARLNMGGGLDKTFDAGTGPKRGFVAGRVWSVALQTDGKVLVGGDFTAFNGASRNVVARLDENGNVDSTFNPGTGEGTVIVVTAQTDGKMLIGGSVSPIDGTNRIGIARLNADGNLDGTFNAGTEANDQVNCIAVQTDGKLVLGGVNGSTQKGFIARLNSDGSLDSTFNSGTGADGSVVSVALQSNGKVVVGGHFTTFDGASRNYIARVNADGSLDGTFSPSPGANDLVWSVAVQSDGKILVGGDFDDINDGFRGLVARLMGDPVTVSAVSLNIQRASNQVRISWTSPLFSLQSGPFVSGSYSDLSGATSPYTNSITGPQRFFRLKAN